MTEADEETQRVMFSTTCEFDEPDLFADKQQVLICDEDAPVVIGTAILRRTAVPTIYIVDFIDLRRSIESNGCSVGEQGAAGWLHKPRSVSFDRSVLPLDGLVLTKKPPHRIADGVAQAWLFSNGTHIEIDSPYDDVRAKIELARLFAGVLS